MTPIHPIGSTARANGVLVALFMAFLAAPSIDMLVRPASARGPEHENRKGHAFPQWSSASQSALEYTRNFEAAYSDALGLRDVLLNWHSKLRLELLGMAPSGIALLGKDGWMFYTGESSVETWRGLNPLTEKALQGWQLALEKRRDLARSLGADYFFVIGPNKESIYPDYLPRGYEPLGPSRLEQFQSWMEAHSDVRVIDLRPCLVAARSGDTPQHYLYNEEGSHWHGRGCMAAANEILRRIAERFPAVARAPETRWQLHSAWPGESWRTSMYLEVPARILGDDWRPGSGSRRAWQIGNDPWAQLQRFKQFVPAPELPRAVMFHDSFGGGVDKLLAERLSQLTADATVDFDAALVAEERPALVLDLYVERKLALPSARPFVPHDEPAPLHIDPGSEADFQASQDTRLSCDLGTPLEALGVTGNLRLEARMLKPAPGILLSSSGADDTLILPPLTEGPGRDLVVRIEIDSPRAAIADLCYGSAEGEPWSELRRLLLPLQRGKNSLWVRIGASARASRLRLRPAQEAGDFLLRSVEVRALQAP